MSFDLRQKTFLLLALKNQKKNVGSLFEFLGDDDRSVIQTRADELLEKEDQDVDAVVEAELKKLAHQKTHNYFHDVHSDWIVEFLKHEPAEIISLVLRYLPAERSHYILNALPEDVLKDMPSLSQTFDVDMKLVELLRLRFEKIFEYDKVYEPASGFQYSDFSLLPKDVVFDVFLELGYREIALGLVTVPEKTQNLVLERLLPEDRKRVEYFLISVGQLSDQRKRRAQVHVISKEVDASRPRLFVQELGFLVYAKTLTDKDQEDFEVLKKKFSYRDAMVLQRLVEKQLLKNTEASVVAYREDLLVAAKEVLRRHSLERKVL